MMQKRRRMIVRHEKGDLGWLEGWCANPFASGNVKAGFAGGCRRCRAVVGGPDRVDRVAARKRRTELEK
jgi:hypothetical protein